MLVRQSAIATQLVHLIYGFLLIALLFVFWSPLSLIYAGAKAPALIFFWRSMTALCFWIIFLCLLLISRKAKVMIFEEFLSFSVEVRGLILLFFMIGVLSASFAVNTPTAFKVLGLYFSMLLAVLLLASYFREFPHGIDALVIVIIVCAISYFLAVVGHIDLPGHIGLKIFAGQSDPAIVLRQYNFSNPRFLDHFISWFLPICCLPLLELHASKCRKILAFIAMFCLWFFAFAHASRALLVEYGAIFIILGALNIRMTLRFFSFQLFACVSALLSFMIVNHSIGVESVFVRDFLANHDRFILWQKTLAIALHHFFLGVGALNLLFYLHDYPHNIVLTVFAEWGVFGLAIFLLLGLRSLRLAFRLMKNQRNSARYFVASAAVLAAMTHALFSNVFRLPLSQVSAVFAIGLLLSFMPQKNRRCGSFLLLGLNLLLLALILNFVLVPMYFSIAM